MSKQISIKQIAAIAGVSAGTVDRVLHNRGKVSAKNKEAVENALAQVNYKINIHTSAVSFRKTLNIVVTTPEAEADSYWASILDGITSAREEYHDISINLIYKSYSQFDENSCREVFAQTLEEKPDAVIIGPTFSLLTKDFCSQLDSNNTPYVFVDATIEGTNPYASFTTDQMSCGLLVGKLLEAGKGPVAVLSTERIGERSHNTILREKGIVEYFHQNGITADIRWSKFSAIDKDCAFATLDKFFKENKDVRNIAVLNSRGYIVADCLQRLGLNRQNVISFDITKPNRECLNKGSISILICQRPEAQGYKALDAIIHKLFYNLSTPTHHLMPIDVVFRETLPFYSI